MDPDAKHSCVQADAGVESVLLLLASHRGLRSREFAGSLLLPESSREEATMSITRCT